MNSVTLNDLNAEESTVPQLQNTVEPVNIHFQDVQCSVPISKFKFWSKEKKEILKNVSGDFQSNKLTAVIGPSGCGKTTLMDVVSGYRIKGVSGYVYVNGMERNIKKLFRQCCYITQDDKLQPLVTILEAMTFVANLKLQKNVSLDTKEITIMKILKNFSLLERQHTLTRDLDESERKRLTIALELISNPSVLFLDEPTRDLDSKSARECLEILRKLSTDGRTVVCSVRQPSSTSLFSFFDNAYILSEGRCIYQGTVDNTISYLHDNNFDCPVYCNPVEYVTDISQDHAENLVQAVGNGKSQEWLESATCWSTIPLNTLNIKHIQRNQIEDSFHYANPFTVQLHILLKRIFLIAIRDRFRTYLTVAANVSIGFALGLFFIDVGNNGGRIFDNFNLLFLCLIFVMYNALTSRIITFPQERTIIQKEYFKRWYSLKAYYTATVLGDIPLQIICVTLFLAIVYFISEQVMEWFRFGLVVLNLCLLAIIFQDYGIFVGTLLDVQNGLILGLFSTSPWVLFSGFLLFRRDTPKIFHWVFKVSMLRKAFEAVTISLYGFGRKPLECYEIYCHFRYMDVFLKYVDVDPENFYWDIGVLIILVFVTKICCYLALKYRLSFKK